MPSCARPCARCAQAPAAGLDGLLRAARMPERMQARSCALSTALKPGTAAWRWLQPTCVRGCATCCRTQELRSGGGWAVKTPVVVLRRTELCGCAVRQHDEEGGGRGGERARGGGGALAQGRRAGLGRARRAHRRRAPRRSPRVHSACTWYMAKAAAPARRPLQAARQPRRTRRTCAPCLRTPGLTLILSLGRAELPRDVREALVSWNHAQEYDCPTYEDYAARLGGGQFEKVYDLGAALCRPGRAA